MSVYIKKLVLTRDATLVHSWLIYCQSIERHMIYAFIENTKLFNNNLPDFLNAEQIRNEVNIGRSSLDFI